MLLDKILVILFYSSYWKLTELAIVDRQSKNSTTSDISIEYRLDSDGLDHNEKEFKNLMKVLLGSDDSTEPFSSAKVVFPETVIEKRAIYVPKCTHPYFCENMPSYPQQHLTTVLNKSKDLQFFFGVDEEPIENRIGGPGEKNLCESRNRLIFPQALKNTNNQWRYVVNQGSQFRQGVRIETCMEEHTPCKLVEVPYTYVSTCIQKYSYRRMLAISDKGEPEGDFFIVPTACCCSYKRIF